MVIDSINGGKTGGTKFRFDNDDVTAHFQEKISAHEVGIQDVLTMLNLTGRKIPQVTVIGAEPVDVTAGVRLSPVMQKLVPETAAEAVNILAEWGITARPKVQTEKVDFGVVS